MAPALASFVRERFPLPVTVPVALVLAGAPLALREADPLFAAVAVASVWAGLLALRILDDLADLPRDRARRPGRGLPSGRIDPVRLGRSVRWLVAGVLVASVAYPFPCCVVLAVVGAYAPVFLPRTRIPRPARPPLVNLVFLAIPLYAGLPDAWPAALWLGLFAWLGAVAHDYAHDPGEAGVGARPAALLGAAGMLAAAGCALAFAATRPSPAPFLLALAVVGMPGLVLVLRRRHDAVRVVGFLFFLVPLAVLVVEGAVSP